MNTTQNTVLITGGGSGIGFEMAKQFVAQGNQVIIVGRNGDRLKRAAEQLQHVTAIVCDITDEQDVDRLISRLRAEFPLLNLVINNAGQAYVQNLAFGTDIHTHAVSEMTTNYLAVVRLNEQILTLLNGQPEAAIVNVTSVVAFVPWAALATYSATKAALHSYTQSLRHALAQKTNIRVFELMPPLVDTEFSQEVGGSNGIAPSIVADALIAGLQTDTYEIRVGQTEQLYHFSRSSPADAFATLNGVSVPAEIEA